MLMGEKFNEDAYEQVLISLFNDLGYEHECGYDVERDYSLPYHKADLLASLKRLNPECKDDVIEQGVVQLTNINMVSMEQRNELFTKWLQGGLEVSYQQNNDTRTALLKLADYVNIDNNLFKVVNQWRIEDIQTKRCDIVVMLNGLPLVVIELKSAISEEADIHDAYLQIRN